MVMALTAQEVLQAYIEALPQEPKLEVFAFSIAKAQEQIPTLLLGSTMLPTTRLLESQTFSALPLVVVHRLLLTMLSTPLPITVLSLWLLLEMTTQTLATLHQPEPPEASVWEQLNRVMQSLLSRTGEPVSPSLLLDKAFIALITHQTPHTPR